jgi:NADP-dependent 3-hydroxy acid dehydrogenase YdfG
MPKLENQIAVITGASSGIGKAIALSLSEKGVTLCLIGRNLKTLEAVTEIAKSKASQVKTYKVDLNIDDDIQKLRKYLQQDFEHVDILIYSAGAISLGMLENARIEDLDWQYRINVRAPYLLTQALLPMIKTKQGQIVFINSSVGLKASANVGQYSATKHALKAVTDSLRDEVNTYGIRVLSIYPGRTATPMQALVHELEDKAYEPEKLMQPEDVAEVVVNALSLPRTAEVTDIHIRPLNKIQ